MHFVDHAHERIRRELGLGCGADLRGILGLHHFPGKAGFNCLFPMDDGSLTGLG